MADYSSADLVGSPADFESTLVLTGPQLDALLRRGDAQARVWAAWRIALRRGSASFGQLRAHSACEPDGGTKRHLLIVLAGQGERELLRTIADGDPDAVLREDAAILLWRTALDPTAHVLPFIRRRLDDETNSGVLLRLLAITRSVSGHTVAPELRKLARDHPDPRVRSEAFQQLLNGLAVPVPEVIELLTAESEVNLRRRFLPQAVAHASQHALALAAGMTVALCEELLCALSVAGAQFEWAELQRFSPHSSLAGVVLELLDGSYPPTCRLWLLNQLGFSTETGLEGSAYPHDLAWVHALRAYCQLSDVDVTAREREIADRVAAAVARADAASPPSDDWEDESMHHQRRYLATIGPRDQARRNSRHLSRADRRVADRAGLIERGEVSGVLLDGAPQTLRVWLSAQEDRDTDDLLKTLAIRIADRAGGPLQGESCFVLGACEYLLALGTPAVRETVLRNILGVLEPHLLDGTIPVAGPVVGGHVRRKRTRRPGQSDTCDDDR